MTTHLTLFPHQVEGVKWMLARERANSGPKGGFLCDEMGVGKTAQVISTISENLKMNTLIIVPKSIIGQWEKEIHRFAPHVSVYVYDGPDRFKDIENFKNHRVTISSYGLLTEKDPILLNVEWGRVVLDEGHEIRNRRAKRSKAACALKSDIKWVITGTPIFNKIDDFVSLSAFVGFSRLEVQCEYDTIKNGYILRRTKNDHNISCDATKCIFENVEIEMYPEEKEFYKDVFMESQDTIKEIFKNSVGNVTRHNMAVLECFLRARQAMIWPQLYNDGVSKQCGVDLPKWEGRSKKMETLFRLISEHPSEKTLIFCQFIGEMNHISEQLDCPVFRIDGACSREKRETQLKKFAEAPMNSVMIIQVKAGGQGLNIQCASRVYITSPAWNPGTELQAIGRCHRSGQKRDVYVKKLIYVGDDACPSVEEAIIGIQVRKSKACAEVLNDKRLESQIPASEKMANMMSISEVRNIFRA